MVGDGLGRDVHAGERADIAQGPIDGDVGFGLAEATVGHAQQVRVGRELVGEPGPLDGEVRQGLGRHRPLVGGRWRDQEALGDRRVVQLGGAHGQGEARDGRSLGNAHIGHEAGDARLGQQTQGGAGAAGEDEALRRDAHARPSRHGFGARGGPGLGRPALEGPCRGRARHRERARAGQDGSPGLFDGGPQRVDEDEHAALDAGFGGAA